MMKFSKQLFVENSDHLIYELKDIELKENGLAYLYLDLVCGYDYVDPDNSNKQGYVDKNNFVEEVQHEIVSCDVIKESLKQAFNNDGYNVIKELPKIYNKGVEKCQKEV